ncbi:MAG TPA: type II toxin-antitoxin system VapC family toxin [Pseudonocardiaceae bacterium]|nr:type II toxin-antitoxin system VapC family toxin [Pseudonocardiaceae bacterium]
MIYLDSCALYKLVMSEAESEALDAHVMQENRRGQTVLASELAYVEVRRALIRAGADQRKHGEADALLDAYAKLPVGPTIQKASRLTHPHLRSLDALHLATAASLGKALTEFITYDRKLGKCAQEAGLPVLAPGT